MSDRNFAVFTPASRTSSPDKLIISGALFRHERVNDTVRYAVQMTSSRLWIVITSSTFLRAPYFLPIALMSDKTNDLPGLSRHLLMNGDTVSARSCPARFDKCLFVRKNSGMKSKALCLQRVVFGFRLQGDSLAPAGAEEDPAARVPEQAVPEVMCE